MKAAGSPAELLAKEELVVDKGILATVDPDVVDPPAVETPDDIDATGLGILRLLRGNGLRLILDPAAESSLPSDPEGGDTVRCCGIAAGATVVGATAAGRCRPSCSI